MIPANSTNAFTANPYKEFVLKQITANRLRFMKDLQCHEGM